MFPPVRPGYDEKQRSRSYRFVERQNVQQWFVGDLHGACMHSTVAAFLWLSPVGAKAVGAAGLNRVFSVSSRRIGLPKHKQEATMEATGRFY